MGYTGEVAVVTGGASGIGAATVLALRRRGAIPVVWDLEPGESGISCDVSDPQSVSSAMRATTDRFGVPGFLVCAAGVFSAGALETTSVAEWNRVMAVNATGTFFALTEVVRAQRAAQRDGSVVLVASVNAVVADPLLGAYSASKAAVVQLGKVAAVELGRHGIRVNVVCPGTTATPMLRKSSDADFRAEVAAHTPLGRMGEPDDVAETIVAVLSLDWVTGQVIAADGGSSLATARGGLRRAALESAGGAAPFPGAANAGEET